MSHLITARTTSIRNTLGKSDQRGAEVEAHYTVLLRELGQASCTLGQIFTKAKNKTQDTAKLLKIMDMYYKEQYQ